MSTKLTPHTFMLATTSAGVYGRFAIDYAYDEDRLRSVSGTRSDTNDWIYVLLETVVPVYPNDGSTPTTFVTVTATATVFTSANPSTNSCVIQGPFTHIKIEKVGTSGAATFVGIL